MWVQVGISAHAGWKGDKKKACVLSVKVRKVRGWVHSAHTAQFLILAEQAKVTSTTPHCKNDSNLVFPVRKFPYSYICDRFIYSQDWSPYFAAV